MRKKERKLLEEIEKYGLNSPYKNKKERRKRLKALGPLIQEARRVASTEWTKEREFIRTLK